MRRLLKGYRHRGSGTGGSPTGTTVRSPCCHGHTLPLGDRSGRQRLQTKLLPFYNKIFTLIDILVEVVSPISRDDCHIIARSHRACLWLETSDEKVIKRAKVDGSSTNSDPSTPYSWMKGAIFFLVKICCPLLSRNKSGEKRMLTSVLRESRSSC